MYFDMSSYNTGVAGPMWPQEMHHNGWYQQNYNQQNYTQESNWNLWGHEQPKQWGHDKPWGQDKQWGNEKMWNRSYAEDKMWNRSYEEIGEAYGRQEDYRDYNTYQVSSSQIMDNRLRQQASQLSNLADEPDDVLVVNSLSSGAYSSLCADAAAADLVAFDAEWAPDHAYGSDNPISVLQLAFPLSRRVYVLQLNRLNGKLPAEVMMMLVNPEVRKVGFAVDLNDRAKLARSGIALTNGSVTDIQELCAVALGAIGKPSLKNCAFGLLGMRLEKDKRISCSDWASKDLTAQQIRYAALDAWVPLRLCYQLS